MKMFLKLFFLIIISYTHAERIINNIYGFNGGIPVMACFVGGGHCEGVVLLADWVVVLDSCIRAQNTEHIYVQKGLVNCTQEKTTLAMGPTKDSSVRSVELRLSHPLAPGVDLALLRLDRPFADELGNDTTSFKTLNILDRWMKSILYPTTEKTHRVHTESYKQTQYQMYFSPVKMFFATVILPSISFALFFLFIVFCTGTTDDTRRIPYKTLSNDKESSHV